MRGFVPSIVVLGIVLGLLAASGSVARADTRPRVAVLGLEVTSAVDVRTTELAHDLTEGMRARARLGSGPYAYAPSSERELIDEKLIKQCDNEAPACMSEIGKELDADVIVYGKLEKDDKVVRVTLHLLDVNKKSKLNRIGTVVAMSASKDDVKAAARKAYEELAGASAAGGAGTVEIEANVPDGTVFVDDSSSETLVNGKATLTLTEGRYRIAVESAGKQRKEITVTVKAEQVITQQFDLVAGSGRPGGRSGASAWKWAFIGTGVVGGGLGIYSFYMWMSWRGDITNIRASKPTPGFITADDCDGGKPAGYVNDKSGVFESVCSTRRTNVITGIIAGAMIVPFAITGYMAFFRGDKRNSESRQMALTPVVTPDTAGAMFHMTF